MGIQIMPSTGDQVAGAISGLGHAIDKFINPNRDIQLAVRNAAATNPELLQHMADIESQNPGTMTRLGLGTMGDVIGTIAPSTGGITEQALRPGAAESATAKQGAQTATAKTQGAQAGLTGDIVKKAGNIMAQDPSITFDAALKTLTGQTGAERSTEKAKAGVATEASKRQIEQLQRAGKLPEDMSQVDWHSKAVEFLNSRLDGGEVSAYFGNPDTSKAFQEAIDGVKQERQLAASKAIAAMHGDKSVDNFRTQKAFQEYQRSGGVGDIDAWTKFLFDPATQDKARGLVSGAVKPSGPEDQAILAIAKVTKQQVDLDKIRDITSINDKINSQMKKVDTAVSDQEREVQIDGLNQLLQQRSVLGGLKVKATYNDRGFWLPGRIEYKTPDGKMVDEAVVNAVIADPMGSDIMKNTVLNDRAKNALTMIQNYDGDKSAALGKFKMQDRSANKEDSRAVERELMKMGLIKTIRVGGNTGEAARP